MDLTLTLTFRPFEDSDRPHFTIRTELPVDIWAVQMLVDDLQNLIDDFYAPTFDLIALNPCTGEDILMELGEFDLYRYKYEFSAFGVCVDKGKQPGSLLERVQDDVLDAIDTDDDKNSLFDLSVFGPEM